MVPIARRPRKAVDGPGDRRAGFRRHAGAGSGSSGQEGAGPMRLNGRGWAPIGPSPINQGSITANGQVTAIAVHPNNANIIYIGTAWGGVWLTHDGGNTSWTPIFDRAPALGIGEPAGIAIDPVD